MSKPIRIITLAYGDLALNDMEALKFFTYAELKAFVATLEDTLAKLKAGGTAPDGPTDTASMSEYTLSEYQAITNLTTAKMWLNVMIFQGLKGCSTTRNDQNTSSLQPPLPPSIGSVSMPPQINGEEITSTTA